MGHMHVFESIDITMQDFRKKSSPFRGLTVLLAEIGDKSYQLSDMDLVRIF